MGGIVEVVFTARVVGTATAVPLFLRLPLPLALRGVTARPVRWPIALPTDARQVRLVDRVLQRDRGPLRPNCVVRSMILARYLQSRPSVRFGVRRGPGGSFDGHAWLVEHGEPAWEVEDPRPLYRETFTWTPGASPVVRRFFHGDRALKIVTGRSVHLGRVLKAVHAGVWLGAAAPSTLAAVDEEAYRRAYAYHSTDAHNARGLFDWEQAAVSAHFPPRGRLLVTSVGGGREVLALRALGFEVTGFECHPVLREEANARVGGGIHPAPRDTCLVLGDDFEGAIVGWGAFTYLRGHRLRVAFLRQLRANLKAGAPALLSFYTRSRDSRRLKLVVHTARLVQRFTGGKPLEVGDMLDPTFQHYFTEEEVRSAAAEAGFSLLAYSTEGFGHAVLQAR